METLESLFGTHVWSNKVDPTLQDSPNLFSWILPRQQIRRYTSYKILSIREDVYNKQEGFAVYELNNSNSWRILDFTPDFKLWYYNHMSFKGKTYWFAKDEKEKQLGVFLVSFDYTT